MSAVGGMVRGQTAKVLLGPLTRTQGPQNSTIQGPHCCKNSPDTRLHSGTFYSMQVLVP